MANFQEEFHDYLFWAFLLFAGELWLRHSLLRVSP
jgi:hypothetical protein